jgi:DNA-directed RNA polymerase subunit RPC12/RpoP
MGRAIRYTCSHCEREIYFDPRVGLSFDALSALSCPECGQSGAVLTLDVEVPPDTPILERVLGSDEDSPRKDFPSAR